MKENSLPKVSVVFITYNRPSLLVKAIKGIEVNCNYPNLELIVTDDGSNPPIDHHLSDLTIDKVLKNEKNMGLGVNSNNGLRAASGDFILHNQDDFECINKEPFIESSIEIMETHPEVGLVRLHHLTPFPNKTDHKLSDGTEYSILEFEQPYNMKNYIYIYSDHPHLKRSDFHNKVGYFSEGLPVGETEDEFCNRFNSNQGYKVATFWRTDLFQNNGKNNSTRSDYRTSLRKYMNKNVIGKLIFNQYAKLPETVRKKIR